jgi:hypothetical protein
MDNRLTEIWSLHWGLFIDYWYLIPVAVILLVGLSFVFGGREE